MKYVFIVNPVAGKENPLNKYGKLIKDACESRQLDYEILVTECPGNATELAVNAASKATEENPVRIFSVGGDGTLCEISSGVIGYENCELGCIPCGSGNDYIKCFGTKQEFLDLDNYICSGAVAVDAIKAGDIKSINICSMGLDANICHKANELKEKNKKLSGSKAYNKAIAICIMGKLYNKLKVTIDDSEVFEGKYLFSIAASGQYYGGGVNSAPMADPTDGLLDFILIKNVSHLRALGLVSKYKSGEYVHSRCMKKILTLRRGKKLHVEAADSAIVNIDGECSRILDITFEVMEKAVKFIVPASYLSKNPGREDNPAHAAGACSC